MSLKTKLDTFRHEWGVLSRHTRNSAEKYGRGRLYRLYVAFDMFASIFAHGARFGCYEDSNFEAKSHAERCEYLTFGRLRKILKKTATPKVVALMEDKKAFNKAFSAFLKRDWLAADEAPDSQIAEFFARHSRVMIKPANGVCGKGIRILTNAPEEVEKFLNSDRRGLLIEEVLKNHKDLSPLNPTSLNTLRVYTCVGARGGMTIIAAALKIGGENAVVDNYHSGGIACSVNLETGVVDSLGVNENRERYAAHAGTKQVVLGYRVPLFEGLEDFMKEVTAVCPEAKYVGWDIAVTDSGFALIEGNAAYPGTDLLQINGGKYKKILAALK